MVPPPAYAAHGGRGEVVVIKVATHFFVVTLVVDVPIAVLTIRADHAGRAAVRTTPPPTAGAAVHVCGEVVVIVVATGPAVGVIPIAALRCAVGAVVVQVLAPL